MSTKIWCPGCEWKPQPSPRWVCAGGCRYRWNTFDTGGVYPACAKVWHDTQCLSCHNRYPPVDWHHADGEHPLATHDLIDLLSGVPVVESVA